MNATLTLRVASIAALLLGNVAHADLIIDVNGTQVADDPTNSQLIDVSGSVDGTQYFLQAAGANSTITASNFWFYGDFTAASSTPGPVTVSLTETNLGAPPVPFEVDMLVHAACTPPVIPPGGYTLGPCVNSHVPFGSTSIWLDANNGGANTLQLYSGEIAYTYESTVLPLSAQANGLFSLTEEVTFDPAIFSSLPGYSAGFLSYGSLPTAVPEPGMLPLMALGLLGIALTRRARKGGSIEAVSGLDVPGAGRP